MNKTNKGGIREILPKTTSGTSANVQGETTEVCVCQFNEDVELSEGSKIEGIDIKATKKKRRVAGWGNEQRKRLQKERRNKAITFGVAFFLLYLGVKTYIRHQKS